MNLASVLNLYSDGYWDFKDVKNDGIHSIASYPAPMVAPMQHEILSLLLKENPNYKKMLDPFHGSGVTLVEGQSLGLEVWGIDINPYAHIISLAKLEKYDLKKIEAANKEIIQRVEGLRKNNVAVQHSFDNIQKWFRDDVIDDLRIIRTAIIMEPDSKIRRYFWLCFGEIVKRYSNTRASTFKLHIKQAQRISTMENYVLSDFFEKIEGTYKLIGYPSQGKFQLTCGDSIEIMRTYEQSSFDIICTSPPYGDNATTVTYGQFSVLQLLWIDNNDFQYDINCVDNFSKIDSMSLGGAYSVNNSFYYSPIVSEYISQLSPHKRIKMERFYADYENAFRLMTRLLKPSGSMVLTLGNRMVDRMEFPFIEVNKEIAKYYGLKLKHVINRNIMKKRMPVRVSRLSDGKPVDSMSKETVLLFKKGDY